MINTKSGYEFMAFVALALSGCSLNHPISAPLASSMTICHAVEQSVDEGGIQIVLEANYVTDHRHLPILRSDNCRDVVHYVTESMNVRMDGEYEEFHRNMWKGPQTIPTVIHFKAYGNLWKDRSGKFNFVVERYLRSFRTN